MIRHQKRLNRNQEGFASIVIGLILVLVMALLTIGFAELTSREQQDSLDRQLANQAYYAAETGINDTYKGIEDGISNPSASDAVTSSTVGVNNNQCIALPVGINPTINSSSRVSYACVMVNLAPPELDYTNIADGAAKTSVFTTSSDVKKVTVTWTPSSGTPAATGTNFLPVSGGASNWDAPAVLQVNITPLGTGPYSDEALAQNSFTAFLYPSHGAGAATTTYSPGFSNNGPIVYNTCNGSASDVTSCTASITGISGTGPYLIHIMNLYQETSEIVVQAYDSNVSVTPLPLSGAQADIDVTGKAQDVLKRLKVAAPLNSTPDVPDFAVEAENICKRFETYPNMTNFIDPDGSTTTDLSDPCYLQ